MPSMREVLREFRQEVQTLNLHVGFAQTSRVVINLLTELLDVDDTFLPYFRRGVTVKEVSCLAVDVAQYAYAQRQRVFLRYQLCNRQSFCVFRVDVREIDASDGYFVSK